MPDARYLCDDRRHLICLPYSVPGLHAMAKDLGIGRWWFHAGRWPHYDIPLGMLDAVRSQCDVVSPREIVRIIRDAGAQLELLPGLGGKRRARKPERELRQPPAWEPMTEEDRRKARRLASCTFLPGSWDKRFARNVAAMAEAPEPKITPKMRAQLDRLMHRYRRQLGGVDG